MVKNPKFLKNLLTTASAVALVSLTATTSFAGAIATNNAVATAKDGIAGLAGFAAPDFDPAADTLQYGANGTTITTSGNLNHSFGVIDVNGKNGAIFDVKHVVNYSDGGGGFRDLTGIELRVTDAAARIQINDLIEGGKVANVSAGVLIANDLVNNLIVSGTGNATVNNVGNDLIISGGNAVVAAGVANDVASTGGTTVITGDVGNDLANDVGNVTVNGIVTGTSTLGGANPGTTKITGEARGLVTVKGAAAHTTEIGGDLTGGAAFTTDQVITLKGDVNRSVGVVTVTPAVGGTFIADEAVAGKTLRFTAAVGAAANPLKLLQAKGGSDIWFDDATYVKTIDVGTSDSVISLANAAIKIEELKHDNNKVTLKIANNTTLLAGTVVSDDAHRLKGVVLDGAKTLTIADQVNIYAINTGATVGTGIYANGANNGVLVFQGDSIVDAVMPVKINTITLNDIAKTVKFVQAVQTNGNITIGGAAGGVMQFGNNLETAALLGGANDKGTVEFVNEKDATITLGAVGNGLLAAKISGGNLIFANHLAKALTYDFGDQAANITYTTAGDINLTNAGAGTRLNTTITTTSTTGNQNFTIANGDLILGAVGADGKLFGTFSTNKAGNVITVTNAVFFASIGGKDVNGKFTAADGRVQNIGSSDKPMDTVTFVENTKVFGDSYAKELVIEDIKEVSFSKIVAGGKVTLENNGIATFKDGSSLVSTLAGDTDGEGIANFEGSTSIKNDLGNKDFDLKAINFRDKDGKTQSLAGDFYGLTTTFLKTVAKADGATTFHGVVDATDTTFDLGTTGIAFTNNDAKAPSVIKGATTIKTTYDGTNSGKLSINGADTKIDFAGLTRLDVVLKDTSGKRAVDGKEVEVVTFTNGATLANSVVNGNVGKVFGTYDASGNRFVNWTFNNTDFTFTAQDIAAETAKEILAENGASAAAQQNSAKFFDATGGDAKSYADELISIGTNDPKAFTESQERIASPTARTASSAVTAALAQTVSSTTTARMQTLANPAAIRVTQADGVSAGAEDTLRYGAWGSPFYSQGVQKMRKGVSGYKSKTVGGTIGFDTMANDTMIVGVAATIAKTDLKHKNINAGDKTKADTLMFSIYGLQEINDDWFLQGVANFGSTKVKSTSTRIGGLNGVKTSRTATGKYDSMSWGGELLGGYNMNITSMAVITPMLGLDYTRTNDGGFTETGAVNQNLSISKKSVDKTQLVAGVRAVMADIEQSGFVVTPEVHGFVRQALGSKNPKLTVKLDGAGELDTSNNAKLAKTTGNLGLGINASSGMMSYGLTYDAHMANKYVGHQGTFKVRVNF